MPKIIERYCAYLKQDIQTFGSSEELELGVSSGLGGGWDWLKNSRTCNTKFNRHACINNKKKTEIVSDRHYSHSMRRKIQSRERL